MQLANKKLDWDQFLQIRQEVINSWPTGQEVDLADGVAYQAQLPAKLRFAEKLEQAKQEGITLAQPRAGVALVHEHIELLRYLVDEGGQTCCPPPLTAIPGKTGITRPRPVLRKAARWAAPCLTGSRP